MVENANVTRIEEPGWRLKIGIVLPTVCDLSEYYRMAPNGVKIVGVNANASEITREEMKNVRDQRLEAAKELDQWDVDCIIASGGPVSTLEGPEKEREFIDRADSELQASFSTMVEAQVDALRTLDVSSLIVVTPFTEERDRETEEYLNQSGFDVKAIGGAHELDILEMVNSPESASYRHAKKLAKEVDEPFDAIYIPCMPWGSVDLIQPLEEDTGVPVVMSVQGQLWKFFKMGGIAPSIRGYGRLFESLE